MMTLMMVLVGLSSINAQKKIETQLRKYKNDEGVSAMSFSGDITNFFDEKDKIKSKVDNCEVLIFNKKDIANKDRTKINNALEVDGYEMLMNVKSKDTKLEIYSIGTENVFSKVFARVNTGEMNMYFVFTGEIHYNELSKLNLGEIDGNVFGLMNGEAAGSSN